MSTKPRRTRKIRHRSNHARFALVVILWAILATSVALIEIWKNDREFFGEFVMIVIGFVREHHSDVVATIAYAMKYVVKYVHGFL